MSWRSDSRYLGRTQILVLRLLATGDYARKSCRALANDWPNLSESAARGAVNRLYERKLVEPVGWNDRCRIYELTQRGRAVERELAEWEDGDAEGKADIDAEVERRRRKVVLQIKSSRLGGVERITLDELGDPAPKQYGQIYSGSLGTNLVYADDPNERAVGYLEDRWKLSGVINLDTGDLVEGAENDEEVSTC